MLPISSSLSSLTSQATLTDVSQTGKDDDHDPLVPAYENNGASPSYTASSRHHHHRNDSLDIKPAVDPPEHSTITLTRQPTATHARQHHHHHHHHHHHSPSSGALDYAMPTSMPSFPASHRRASSITMAEPQFHDQHLRQQILCLLGRGLIHGGCPTYRVDEVLRLGAEMLSMEVTFVFLPDSILFTFLDGAQGQTVMVKTQPSFDTGKLGRLHALMNPFFARLNARVADAKQNDTHHHHTTVPMEPIPPDPAEGKHDAPLYHNVGNETIKNDEIDENNGVFWTPLELETCVDALRCINDDRPTCGFWGTLFAYTASAFSGCIILFGGSWIDGAVSGALGFVVGLLCYISAKYPVYGRVFELSSSVMVAIAARALHNYTCFSSVVVSSIFMVLPGYSMAIAAMELAARSINIGTIRLVYAVVYAFVLAYGMQVGHSMYSVMDPGAPEDGQCAPSPISHWFFLPLFPLMTVSMGMAYGSSYRQYLTQTLCATVTYLPFYFLGKIIPEGQIVGCLAAFACGLYGNLALKITGEAPIVPVCVGITLLVPGSIGVRGAFAILHREDILHESFPIQMLTICLGLVAGLFSAAMIVYPSGKRRSLYISL